jgi:hypothetical protein
MPQSRFWNIAFTDYRRPKSPKRKTFAEFKAEGPHKPMIKCIWGFQETDFMGFTRNSICTNGKVNSKFAFVSKPWIV